MLKKITLCIILSIFTWGNGVVFAQEFTLMEPFSNQSVSYINLRLSEREAPQPFIVVGGSVMNRNATHNRVSIENVRYHGVASSPGYSSAPNYRTGSNSRLNSNSLNHNPLPSMLSGGVSFQFQKGPELFADAGNLYSGFDEGTSEVESSVMMRGPGGGGPPIGGVDDPVGPGHVLIVFVLIYGFYIYRKRRKTTIVEAVV